jgi:hypothetical protein
MGAGPKSPAALRNLTEDVEELFAAADGDQTVAKPVCLASSLAMGCVRFLPFSSSLSSANCPKSRARSLIAESILSPCELMIPRVTQKTGGCAKSHTTAFFYDEWSFRALVVSKGLIKLVFDSGSSDVAPAERLFNIVQGIANRHCQRLAFWTGNDVLIITL